MACATPPVDWIVKAQQNVEYLAVALSDGQRCKHIIEYSEGMHCLASFGHTFVPRARRKGGRPNYHLPMPTIIETGSVLYGTQYSKKLCRRRRFRRVNCVGVQGWIWDFWRVGVERSRVEVVHAQSDGYAVCQSQFRNRRPR